MIEILPKGPLQITLDPFLVHGVLFLAKTGALGSAGGTFMDGCTKTTVKITIVGSRTFTDYNRILEGVARLKTRFPNLEILSGGARGVDKLAELAARQLRVPVRLFPANWEKHGRRAGMLRNEVMIQQADVVVAIWDGESRGTANAIEWARKLGLRLKVIRF